MLDKIRNAMRKLSEQSKAADVYQRTLLAVLQDSVLDGREAALLAAQRDRLGLDPTSAHRLHVQVFGRLAQGVLADGNVSAEELDGLSQLAASLGVAWTELPPGLLQPLQVASTITQIQRGVLPTLDPSHSVIRAEPGETVHLEIACHQLDQRTYRQFSGGSSGVSIRIAKGVSYRVGSFRGRSIPVSQIVAVDSGVLSITSKRIAYIGHLRNVVSPLSKVLSAEPMSNGVAISFTNRVKTLIVSYDDTSLAPLVEVVLERVLS